MKAKPKKVVLLVEGRAPLPLATQKEGRRAFELALARKPNKYRDIVLMVGDKVNRLSPAKFHDISLEDIAA